MLPKLELPESLNYIGVFFTMSCNLKCSYCINIPDSTQHTLERNKLFPMESAKSHNGMSPKQWIEALNRIPNHESLPITAQGGEPTLYWGGVGLSEIFKGVDHYFDLLTNMASLSFYKTIEGQQYKLQRKSPYPSIRVSFHNAEMNRTWGNGFNELVKRCEELTNYGFIVSPTKSISDVGIYQVAHPSNQLPDENLWKGKVPFETKEFLGVHEGELYGTYAYPHSTDLISRGILDKTLECECRTSELLISPEGFVFRCHYDLYETYANGGLEKEFNLLQTLNFEFTKYEHNIFNSVKLKPIGHILDPEFTMDVLKEFRKCYSYGTCSSCDVKYKNDRHQSLYDNGVGHSSVEIRNIKFPKDLTS